MKRYNSLILSILIPFKDTRMTDVMQPVLTTQNATVASPIHRRADIHLDKS